MRKLILLALAIGVVELLKRRSAQLGVTPFAVLTGVTERGLDWISCLGHEDDGDPRSDAQV